LLEVSGNPAILFEDTSSSVLNFLRASDTGGLNWSTPVMISAQTDDVYALAMVDGRPAIVYTDRIDNRVKFIAANDAVGKNWGHPAVVTSEWGNANSSHMRIELTEISGKPALVVATNGDLSPKYYGFY
jgi:hypothetical protein